MRAAMSPASTSTPWRMLAGVWLPKESRRCLWRVGPGSIVYVAAETPHHFHSIETELRVLVFFAPAETG